MGACKKSLSAIGKGRKRLVMLGGKGGVGKTTCAAAIALYMAETGRKTLILSSDPTPSLSDIFEISVGAQETSIPNASNLTALEISSEIVLQKWKERFGPEIYEVVSSFADLDYDFVLDYVGGAPGIEEEYMLYYIMELVREGRYDQVIWDSAPAGHTLQLLHLPDIFLRHLEGATRFYLNIYSYLERAKEVVKLQKGKSSLLDIISGWQDLSGQIAAFIRDERSTEYILVTIPEALGVKQTERIIQDFDAHGLPVHYLIINHVVEEADCAFHRMRKEMQSHYIRLLSEEYGERFQLVLLPLSPNEIKGIERIRRVSHLLFS
ncbi:MAG: ArsA family ATPase [Deltaproteobacteria bacterium]|nr:MAG: ArsA family ATPase [Deltaproteobacteria bacterium]